MADIELGNDGDRGDRPDRLEAEPMAGMAFEAERFGMAGGRGDALELVPMPGPDASQILGGLAIGAGVKLDHRAPAPAPGRAEAGRDR